MTAQTKRYRCCFVASVILLGCQDRTPEPVKSAEDLANVEHVKAFQEGLATRPLNHDSPVEETQKFRDPELEIVWYGEQPGTAEVYVNGTCVGRGRPGFVIAAKSFDNVPRRGKILLVHGEPRLVLRGDSSNIADVADPFSAWPDLGSAFLRMAAEKEVYLVGQERVMKKPEEKEESTNSR